jgi:RimJ/RimL family protein N-acetyltransferase
MIELTGKHVVLRPLERAHCRLLWERYEPEIQFPTEPLNVGASVEGAEEWFEDIQAKHGKTQVYVGIFTSAGDLVGEVQLANIDWRNRTANVGVGMTKREDRGKGYGTEACRLLIRHGFDQLDLVRVWSRTYEYNEAAQKLLQKLGFTLEGRERAAVYCSGKRWARLIYGLLRDEYEPVQSSGRHVEEG